MSKYKKNIASKEEQETKATRRRIETITGKAIDLINNEVELLTENEQTEFSAYFLTCFLAGILRTEPKLFKDMIAYATEHAVKEVYGFEQ